MSIWIDTRLSQECMRYLWGCISKENKKDVKTAGNIHKSEVIEDKDNWFYETVLSKLTERLFCRDWDVYYKYYIEKEEPPPKFEMDIFWVNYQKQHEFNPLHYHSRGYGYSFVIFMKIPTHWKDQHALPMFANSVSPTASDFAFVHTEKDSKVCKNLNIKLSSEDEGRMLFFPAWLDHLVYPFYECEEERITISGNISLEDPNKSKIHAAAAAAGGGGEDEAGEEDFKEEILNKEKTLTFLEQQVLFLKEELKLMKKEGSEKR